MDLRFIELVMMILKGLEVYRIGGDVIKMDLSFIELVVWY